MKETHPVDIQGRICKKCETFKIWDCFDKKNNGINGHHSQCKECIKAFKRKWWKKKNMKTRVRPTVLELSKSQVSETNIPFNSSEKIELEKILRSMVFDSFIKRRDEK